MSASQPSQLADMNTINPVEVMDESGGTSTPVIAAHSPASPASSSSSEMSESILSTTVEPTLMSTSAGMAIPVPSATAAATLNDPIAFLQVKWDPLAPEKEYPSDTALRRMRIEMADCIRDPVEGIHVCFDESNMSIVHALVVGPRDTPYAGGFFYFYIRIPGDYPWEPPRIKLMTTGNGKVRFNPNLYNSGKVCLSILGTWPGPSWTAALSVKSVLLSIQSIMNRTPFFNEPAYEGQESSPLYQAMSEEYTDNIRFETLRVAVLGMMEAGTSNGSGYSDSVNMPKVLRDIMRRTFLENVDFYTTVLNDNVQNMTKSKMNYKWLQTKFNKLIEKERAIVAAAGPTASTSTASTSTSTSMLTKAKTSKIKIKTPS